MPRGKRTEEKCNAHDFDLKPQFGNVNEPQYLNVSFCTPKIKTNKNKKSNQKCQNLPIFNHDDNFATPGFILACDKDNYRLRGEQMRKEHEHRFTNYCDQQSEMNIPKPRSKNSYCAVCKITYEDYLEHIYSPAHKNKIQKSKFEKHIRELTKLYNFDKIDEQSLKIKPQPQASTNLDDPDVEIIQKPHKKVKTNQEILTNLSTTRNLLSTNHYPFAQYGSLNMNWPLNLLMNNYPHNYNSLLPSLPFPMAYRPYSHPFVYNNSFPMYPPQQHQQKEKPIVIVIDQ